MDQEQLANQQQQQHSHSARYIAAPDYFTPTNSQAPLQKRDNTPNDNATSLDNVFMPKDDAINSSDGEIEEIDRELEEFKRFCLLTKPL